MKMIVATILVSFSTLASAEEMGAETYCSQLAEIGGNAYNTKKAGVPMGTVLDKVGYILSDDPRKKAAAQGVIIAVYGDSSIRNEGQAYRKVYSACRR